MELGIRRVCLPDDRVEIMNVLNRNFGTCQERRFSWRHIANPAGRAWSWFMYDKATLATVAMATVFPRHMRFNGTLIRAGQVGEFAVDSKYRSLGPAVRLQRTTFEPVDAGEISFCYDCPPHDEGMSTFARIGMRPNCEVHRYALLLRSDEYLSRRLGDAAWTRPVVAAANLILRTRKSKGSRAPVEICEHVESFGDEFSKLDEAASVAGTIRASRHQRDLNWRYVEDPMASICLPNETAGRYRVFTARRAGELVAFLVFFIQSDGVACLVDIFGFDLVETGLALLEVAVQVCKREHVSSFHAFCSDGSDLKPVLVKMGFRRRERNARVVAYARQEDSALTQADAKTRWAFSQLEVML